MSSRLNHRAKKMAAAAAKGVPHWWGKASQGIPQTIEGPTELVKKTWERGQKRTGLLALKVGMVPWWDDWGVRHAATVLQVDRCQVVQVKTDEANGYTGMQLGVGKAKLKNVSKSKLGHHTKVGVEPKDKLWEFRCSEDGLLPAGTVLRAQHFVPGQNVDVAGITKGKGFQGVMKRHGFGGQPASHGNSKAHRKPGGIGACQDPGRVWKGKKMPGRMGGNRRTIENLQVLQIDTERELLYIKGALPGPKGRFLRVRDSYKKPNFPEAPPFPTYIDDGSEDTPKILKAKLGPVDPMDDSELLS